MYRMVRSFLPIGHGGFYTELFIKDNGEKINIVYDCGSKNKKLLESQIEHHFQKDETIHALFISHLHTDHINGIPHLLKHCKVKNIFYPLLTEREYTLTALYNAANSGDEFSIKFALDPRNTISTLEGAEETLFYEVKADDDDDDTVEDFLTESGRRRIFYSGQNAAWIVFGKYTKCISSYDWILKPFNFRHKKRLKELENGFVKEFGKALDNSEIKDIWEKNDTAKMRRVKKVYAMWNNHNTYSMTLYSGLETFCTEQYVELPYLWSGYPLRAIRRYRYEVGCLYTGDYEAKGTDEWTELSNAYKDNWDYIGCVQIPHHGSIHNYNDNFSALNAFFIVSAKEGDIKHPASYVMKHLLLYLRPLFVVTERVASRVDSVNYIS